MRVFEELRELIEGEHRVHDPAAPRLDLLGHARADEDQPRDDRGPLAGELLPHRAGRGLHGGHDVRQVRGQLGQDLLHVLHHRRARGGDEEVLRAAFLQGVKAARVLVGNQVGAEGDLVHPGKARRLQGPHQPLGGEVQERRGEGGGKERVGGDGGGKISRTSDSELTTRLAPWEQTFTQ